jgi:hypothetical protein
MATKKPRTVQHKNAGRVRPKSTRTIQPKSGGGWQVTGGDAAFDVPTQEQGVERAKQDLLRSGGGELLIKGLDGKVREKNTIGRPDPRKSRG